MEEKIEYIIQSLERIENKLNRLEKSCERGENSFIREVGANVLGDYIYTILENHRIRKNN